ncbi:MAG: hypothetical protein MR473_07605 [Clostridiales bacterium]|nr:hypothetical protein [Clostridiales bacterium]
MKNQTRSHDGKENHCRNPRHTAGTLIQLSHMSSPHFEDSDSLPRSVNTAHRFLPNQIVTFFSITDSVKFFYPFADKGL